MEKQAIKEKIKEEFEKTKKDISDLEEQVKPVSPENAIGRISRMDAINNKSVVEASLRQARDKLNKLESALSRIDDPDFGICVHCRQPIPLARIMLMPQARSCVQCLS